MSRGAILVILAAVGALGVWMYLDPEEQMSGAPPEGPAGPEMLAVTMPELTGLEVVGAQAFEEFCARCHGAKAGGIEGKGPPLIHKIYEPGHHGDFAFVRAAKQGVRSHHWRFGDMPPVEGVMDADIKAIIAFVRKVQQENGIF